MSFMYLWGQPGSGKSTLIQELVAGQAAMPTRFDRLVITEYIPARVAEIGLYREDFRGSDALSMSVINQAIPFVQNAAKEEMSLMAEGDRLCNDRFFVACVEAGYLLELFYINVPDKIAAERRSQRGSDQDPTWLKSRQTKSWTMLNRWEPYILDGTRPVADLVETMAEQSDVVKQFSTGRVT